MPGFQLVGLDPQPFAPLFELDDATLHARGLRRVTASADFGFPCRVSLEDAAVGQELLLLSYTHQPAPGPYHAAGPIFVRRGAVQRRLPPGEVPPSVTRRLISLRAYDERHDIVAADVVDGSEVAARLAALFDTPAVRYVHLHNAKRGCYAGLARPA